MFITNNDIPIPYNLTGLIPTFLDPTIFDPNASNVTYFCDTYNLTLTREDTWIDQISSSYRCGKHLYHRPNSTDTGSDTEDDTDYQTDTDDEDNNNSSPSADDISYSIFSSTGGNLTTIKYPCYSMEETFENHTLWTLNIGRAILCGIQNPQADVLIVESKQREAEMSTASRMGSSATATRTGSSSTAASTSGSSGSSTTSSSSIANYGNRNIQGSRVLMVLFIFLLHLFV